MRNFDIPAEAVCLIEEAADADNTAITVLESSGLVAANFAGMIACIATEGEIKPLVALFGFRDPFGRQEIVPKPDGSFLHGKVVPAVERKRRSEKTRHPIGLVSSIAINNAQAAWLFLDGSLTSSDLVAPIEIVDRQATYAELIETRLGWRLRPDWDLNPAEPCLDQAFNLDILFSRRDRQAPLVTLCCERKFRKWLKTWI